MFRQRGTGTAGDHDHGRRDDRLVLGGAGAILAVGIAALLMSRTNVTIYEAQRLNREAAEAERAERARKAPPG
ncbi:hypothetical protein NIIDMKKI_72940 [Mycobacterium kansasii]|uniref:Uncharacterized protein n=1 Tax=Mycobacterium kansasii TaxID=1768 RepID=A0A7G1ITF3_MYCKA|nr:hypothetical protein NIIDMKKI_72940 [Mycobacterium kansasii]